MVGAAMQPFVPALLDRLVLILNRPASYSTKTLLENAAITLGRIAIHHKDICAPRLGEFLESWLHVMGRTADNSEKVDAYRGFCGMVLANPSVVTKVGSCLYVSSLLCSPSHNSALCRLSTLCVTGKMCRRICTTCSIASYMRINRCTAKNGPWCWRRSHQS